MKEETLTSTIMLASAKIKNLPKTIIVPRESYNPYIFCTFTSAADVNKMLEDYENAFIYLVEPGKLCDAINKSIVDRVSANQNKQQVNIEILHGNVIYGHKHTIQDVYEEPYMEFIKPVRFVYESEYRFMFNANFGDNNDPLEVINSVDLKFAFTKLASVGRDPEGKITITPERQQSAE